MTWVHRQIEQGNLKVVRPRNLATLTPAFMPLKPGVKYRTWSSPSKGHFVYPGSDHSFCGFGLCPPEDPDFGAESGWDEVWWFVEDDRPDSMCKQCSDKYGVWQRSKRELPQTSPIPAEEWAKNHAPLAALEQRKWQRLVDMFDGVLEVEEVET